MAVSVPQQFGQKNVCGFAGFASYGPKKSDGYPIQSFYRILVDHSRTSALEKIQLGYFMKVLLHEFGHYFRLAHSMTPEKEYGDPVRLPQPNFFVLPPRVAYNCGL